MAPTSLGPVPRSLKFQLCTPRHSLPIPAHACLHRLRQRGQPGVAGGAEKGNLLDDHAAGSWGREAAESQGTREPTGCWFPSRPFLEGGTGRGRLEDQPSARLQPHRAVEGRGQRPRPQLRTERAELETALSRPSPAPCGRHLARKAYLAVREAGRRAPPPLSSLPGWGGASAGLAHSSLLVHASFLTAASLIWGSQNAPRPSQGHKGRK